MTTLKSLVLPFVAAAAITQSGTAPQMFAPGVISTGDMELNAAFTPDGHTVYFTKRTPKFQQWIIVYSTQRGGKWTTPVVAPFSGTQYSDYDPFVSTDGSKIYFSSNRPRPGTTSHDFDIWVVERTQNGWSEPRNLGSTVNSAADEGYPTASADGTLYFTTVRDGGRGRGDIYRAPLLNGEYKSPENLGDSINTAVTEGDPYISPDENTLIFVAYGRPDGLGDGDMYISRRVNGVWSKARNLGAGINSPALDFCPIMSPDGTRFFFSSERTVAAPADQSKGRRTYEQFIRQIRSPGNGFGDIYSVPASALSRE